MAYIALCLLDSGQVFMEMTVNSIVEARNLAESCFLQDEAARRALVVQQANGQIVATWNREDIARV